MRLYGKKFLRRRMEKRVVEKTETRDAILWSIDEGNFRCRVKIQGSGEYVIAHYPRNWKRHPYWLKPGNAVRLVHRSGTRGYIEVVGEGRAIPLPVEGPALPPGDDTLFDAILTGMNLYTTNPNSLGVIVTSGTYRINGNVYAFSGTGASETEIIMNDPAPMVLGSGATMSMGTVQSELEITDVPESGYYRYDCFVIGEDGVVDYIQGEEVRQNPVQPDIPEGHLLIDRYILVLGGAEVISDYVIGTYWSTPMPVTLEIVPQYTTMPSTVEEMYVAVTVMDQYGMPYDGIGYWTINLINSTEIGEVYSSSSGYDSYSVSQITYGSGYNYFRYKKDTEEMNVTQIILVATLADLEGATGTLIFSVVYPIL